MKIIADSAIPYIDGILEPYADVRYIAGSAIGRKDVADADAIVIRTRTKCNAELLDGSDVKFIATATIGFDHIDTQYCRSRGIEVATCAGCNARGVLQYIAASLVLLSQKDGWQPHEKTLGIVGVGHVGSLVRKYAEAWGFNVLCCDPPREKRERLGFTEIGEIARMSDIITFHTPLDSTTYHLADSKFIENTRRDCVIINSSRGEVADGRALLSGGRRFILDVWENEPHINTALAGVAIAATPHIAGYSAQGKANASSMAIRALAEKFDLPLKKWYPSNKVKPAKPADISWRELCLTIKNHFDITGQSDHFKLNIGEFENIRNSYDYRNEYF